MRSINGELAKYEIKRSMSFDVGHVGVLGNLGGGSAWDWEDDFSTDKGWDDSAVGSNFVHDFTTDNSIEYHFERNGGPDTYILKDLQDADALNGSNLSDTAWVWRFKMTDSAFDSGSGYTPSGFMLMTSTGTPSYGGSHDFIAMKKEFPSTNPRWVHMNGNGIDLHSPTNSNVLTTAPTGADDYHHEVIRTSSTSVTWSLFPDNTFETADESDVLTCNSATINLRYGGLFQRASTNRDSYFEGDFDDMQIADGVTTAP